MTDAFHPLASALNAAIQAEHPLVWPMLSARGRHAFFPKTGILGQTAEAKGCRLNATIGISLEDDGTPMHLGSIGDCLRIEPEAVFPYASSYGLPALRTAWREQILSKNPSLSSAFSFPVVAAGITHALSVAGALFLDPEDTVILPAPFWGNYRLIFEAAFGARLAPFELYDAEHFSIHALVSALEQSYGNCVLLLNFPSNPTGYTPLLSEAEQIRDAILDCAERGRSIVILLDDAYAGLVYERGVLVESLFSLLADLHERVLAVKIDGASKEDYAWGLRVGFLTFASKGMTPGVSAALEEKAAGIIRGSVSNACHLSQSLLLRAFSSPAYAGEKERHARMLERRFHACMNILREERYADAFRLLPCNSGYFLCLEPAEGIDAERVRRILLSDFSIGVIATQGLLRIAFSSVPEERLAELFSHIHAACLRARSPSLATVS